MNCNQTRTWKHHLQIKVICLGLNFIYGDYVCKIWVDLQKSYLSSLVSFISIKVHQDEAQVDPDMFLSLVKFNDVTSSIGWPRDEVSGLGLGFIHHGHPTFQMGNSTHTQTLPTYLIIIKIAYWICA